MLSYVLYVLYICVAFLIVGLTTWVFLPKSIKKFVQNTPKEGSTHEVELLGHQKEYYFRVKMDNNQEDVVNHQTAIGISFGETLDVKRLVKAICDARRYTEDACYVKDDNGVLKYQIYSIEDARSFYKNEKMFKNYKRLTEKYKDAYPTDLYIDISDVVNGDRKKAAEYLQKEIINRETDVNVGPGTRSVLCKYGENKFILVCFGHHLFIDGPYVVFFLNLIATFYRLRGYYLSRRLIAKVIHTKYNLERTQEDVIEYIKKNYSKKKEVKDIEYWRGVLRGANYHFDFDMPQNLEYSRTKGTRVPFEFDSELYSMVKETVESTKSTTFVVLYAIFNCWMSRVFSKKDICSTYVTSVLPKGFFVCGLYGTYMLMRVCLDDKSTLTSVINHISKKRKVERNMRWLSLSKLVKQLKDYNISLPNVVFGLTVFQIPGLDFGKKAKVDTVYMQDFGEMIHDFSCHYQDMKKEKRIKLCFEFKLRLFRKCVVKRFVTSFVHFAKKLLSNKNKAIKEIQYLDYDQYKQQIIVWNNTRNDDYPLHKTIPELFEDSVTKNCDRIAVQCCDDKITYGELNTNSNMVANFLIKNRNIKPGDFVGVIFEKSVEMIAAIVGVQKAGGVYLPMDHTLIRRRVEYILNDTKATCVLIGSSVWEKFEYIDSRFKVSLLDCKKSGKDTPVVSLKPSDLSFVIYTSGSTGEPKGVLIEHRSSVNSCCEIYKMMNLKESKSFAHYLSPSFDMHVSEIFLTLIHSLTLHIIPENIRLIPSKLITHFKKYQIDGYIIPPNLLSEFPKCGDIFVKTLAVMGDFTEPSAMDYWSQFVDYFINSYGPAEITFLSHWKKYIIGVLHNNVGLVFDNMKHYILDKDLRPVIIGKPGQMCISGVGVARGYLNKEKLTKRKFIKNPFGDGTLYLTGDMCYFLENGEVVIVGRKDSQVKISGIRTELGEVEHAVRKTSKVENVVVLYDKKILHCFVIPIKEPKGNENNEDKVLGWKKVFDNVSYEKSGDLKFNIEGWTDSYTGKQISKEEMHEQVSETLRQIFGFHMHKPRVLEIGCGTGLILLKYAPICEEYLATDLSEKVIKYIEDMKSECGNNNLQHVKTMVREAANFKGLKKQYFDTVILNSVIQYFPSVEYLIDVLRKAVSCTKDGGRIWIGDVRNLELLKTFHVSVQLSKMNGKDTIKSLINKTDAALKFDGELVIHPSLFYILGKDMPRITHVQVQPKAGRYENELTKFRYNVILHVDSKKPIVFKNSSIKWFEFEQLNGNKRDKEIITFEEDIRQKWEQKKNGCEWEEFYTEYTNNLAQKEFDKLPDGVKTLIKDEKTNAVGIRNVTNPRLVYENKVLEFIEKCEDMTKTKVDKLFEFVSVGVSIHPDMLYTIGTIHGYDVDISFKGTNKGSFHAILHRPGFNGVVVDFDAKIDRKPYHKLVNLHGMSEHEKTKLGEEITAKLRSIVPRHMIPHRFYVLDKFPTNQNGKIDRKKLLLTTTKGGEERGGLSAKFVPAETKVQKTIVKIIKNYVKGGDKLQLGILDNIKELGIPSIIEQMIATKISLALVVNFELKEFVGKTNVSQLASFIESKMKK
jgi:amino acid adenylation domain-containing protein